MAYTPIGTEKLPIYNWAVDLEPQALEQAKNLANLPFAFHHIALMPDSHMGYGMPIGGVLATDGVVVPNAVGVDIGCGMRAVRTTLTELSADTLKKIMGDIRKVVPVGFNQHTSIRYLPTGLAVWEEHEHFAFLTGVNWGKAAQQLGTLGGGNHFIEIQSGSDGYIWLMIHSGSRNLGKQVADWYNAQAVEQNARWCSAVPKSHELAFLPTDSEVAQDYIEAMGYCVKYAEANRAEMMLKIAEVFVQHTDCNFGTEHDVAHNYARLEHHFGRDVWIHRKGATSAREDELGIIPGSQGTKSYIVRGLGNPMSFTSCSHGAGRRMGRKQAQRELNIANEQRRLDAMGVVHSIRTAKDLDEAPSAYKDIDMVMAAQADLVRIETELTPMGVIKG